MVWNMWQHNVQKILDFAAMIRHPFQIFTTTLLSLLLPLSFLLLARLTTARYLLDFHSHSILILYTNQTLLHGLISIVCVLSLVHGLSNARITTSEAPLELTLRPRFYTVWILLCTLQVLVGLGTEGNIEAGPHGFNIGYGRNMTSKLLFFIGLHEMMLYWSKMIVKPVVDDTIFGSRREERWVERMTMATSFSTLWWWRLKDEVDLLVVVAEVKTELLIDVSVADYVSWWLYYLTVTTGVLRLIKSLLWVGFILFSSKVENNADDFCGNETMV